MTEFYRAVGCQKVYSITITDNVLYTLGCLHGQAVFSSAPYPKLVVVCNRIDIVIVIHLHDLSVADLLGVCNRYVQLGIKVCSLYLRAECGGAKSLADKLAFPVNVSNLGIRGAPGEGIFAGIRGKNGGLPVCIRVTYKGNVEFIGKGDRLNGLYHLNGVGSADSVCSRYGNGSSSGGKRRNRAALGEEVARRLRELI